MKEPAVFWPKLIMLLLLIGAGFAVKTLVKAGSDFSGSPFLFMGAVFAAFCLIYWLMDRRAAARKRQGQPPARRD